MKRKRPKLEVADRESTRLLVILLRMPLELVRTVTAEQLMVGCRINLGLNAVSRIKRKYIEGKEREMSGNKGIQQPKPEDIDAQVVLEQLAGISAKTYTHLGDAEKIGSEEALQLINKILKGYDPSILDRNLKRRLPK